ncbi:MAG: hypothetical protein CFE29_14090 [Bradyrhizobiaceae bacterium PARB1]|jgi:hypothetical protein|nr:MAG: hypothetical protein CFE29_14090 [Bradyrhizobiaceae bacterium PARB1]
MTDVTMSRALLQFKRDHSHAAMRTLLQEVAGVSAISDVPEDKIDDVIAACESDRDWSKPGAKAKAGPKPDFNSPEFVQGVYARWNGAAR